MRKTLNSMRRLIRGVLGLGVVVVLLWAVAVWFAIAYLTLLFDAT